jgi:hypothetical protein
MSPALVLAYRLYLLLQDTPVSSVGEDFQDLGKLMLGGFVAAVGVALVLTFVRFRLRDRKRERSAFMSISTTREDE